MKRTNVFWVIVALLVVGATLAVTFVSLFGYRNTKELAKATNSYVSNGYLSAENEDYVRIEKYVENLNTAEFSEDELKELENFADGYKAYFSISQFFNRQINFMEYTKVYKDNRKSVEKKLKQAQKSTKSLVAQINKTTQITGGVEYWERLAWTTCRDYMQNIIENTINAFNIYAKIYQASVSSKLLNNDYSDVIFFGLQDLSQELKSGYRTTANVGKKLKNYTEIYFTKLGEEQILKYTYLGSDNGTWATIRNIKERGKESLFYESFLIVMPA